MSGDNAGRDRCLDDMRRRAEQELAGTGAERADGGALLPQDVQRLIHELRVHQVELEMQNEELRRVQLSLEASRDSYMELYELSPVAILTLDAGGNIVEANLTAVKLLGVERKNLLRAPLVRFTGAGASDCLHLHLQQVRETQSRQRCEIGLKDREGREIFFQVETTLLAKSYGQVGCFLTVLVDISERKRAEEVIRKSEESLRISQEQYRSLVNNTSDLIYSLDREGRFTAVNESFCRTFKAAEHEFIGNDHHFLCLPEETEREWHLLHRQVFATGKMLRTEIPVPMPEDSSRIYEVALVPIFDQTGMVTGLRGTSRDITARKKMEEELLKADKLDSISILAGGIAHDFNNYLATLLGNISLAKLYRDDKAKYLEKLENMERATMRAKDLSNQLFTFAKGGAPVKENVSLKQLIIDDIKFSLSGSNIWPDFRIAEDLHMVEADKGQISQVINNIVINAMQAMPEGGVLKVRAENVTFAGTGKDSYISLSEGTYVKISIRDEGTGIPQKHLAKIFDPFFTTKDKGRGLGLATSYSIIKKHGGQLQVESQMGVGTTFFIILPAAARAETTSVAGDVTVQGTGKILIMDDEEELLAATGETLAALGYDVTLSRDGGQAIELYTRALEQNQPFNLVILDLTIPGGMGGKQTIKELRKLDPAVKAIVASGYSNDPVMAYYGEYGFKGAVQKPFTIEALSKVVYEAIS